MHRVSLNVDLGELPDEPDELYRIATMVNIACGGHAGNRESMAKALFLASQGKVIIAAHPSYPDREGFGRKTMSIAMHSLKDSLRQQMTALHELAKEAGATIRAVKPHGALYHDAAKSTDIAETFLRSVHDALGTEIAIVGPPKSVLRELALQEQHSYLREGFADRTYLPDGRLVPRSEPNALISDPTVAAMQALHLAKTEQFDTLCVHGDTAGAIEIARAVRKALEDAQLLERQS